MTKAQSSENRGSRVISRSWYTDLPLNCSNNQGMPSPLSSSYPRRSRSIPPPTLGRALLDFRAGWPAAQGSNSCDIRGPSTRALYRCSFFPPFVFGVFGVGGSGFSSARPCFYPTENAVSMIIWRDGTSLRMTDLTLSTYPFLALPGPVEIPLPRGDLNRKTAF